MDGKWPVKGILQLVAVAVGVARCEGPQQVLLAASLEFPFANIGEILGIFLST